MDMKSIPLCPKCIKHELNSWLNEKIPKIKGEIIMQIRQEIRSITLDKGNCIVCNSNKVTKGLFENIISVLNKNRIDNSIKKEFTEMFGFGIVL